MIPLIAAPMFIMGVVVQIWRRFIARTSGPLDYVLGPVSGTDVTIAVADSWRWSVLAILITFAEFRGADQQVLKDVEDVEVDGASRSHKLRFTFYRHAVTGLSMGGVKG